MAETSGEANRPRRKPRRKWLYRVVRFLLLYIGVPYLAICALFAIFQRRLMYPARVMTAEDVRLALADADFVESVSLILSDGVHLNGLIVDPPTDQPSDNVIRPVILYFPGNGGCRIDRLTLCDCFAGLGCRVALFDYRGYGDNLGAPSEKALVSDAHAVWKYLTEVQNVPPSKIYMYGESLGGAVATRLAADLSRAGTPPAGLLVSASFSSMRDVAIWHYPWLPVRLLLFDSYESQSHMPHVDCPVTVVHGREDGIVPQSFGRRLFESAESAAKRHGRQFISVPGAGHNNLPAEVLCSALGRLIAENPGKHEDSAESGGE